MSTLGGFDYFLGASIVVMDVVCKQATGTNRWRIMYHYRQALAEIRLWDSTSKFLPGALKCTLVPALQH